MSLVTRWVEVAAMGQDYIGRQSVRLHRSRHLISMQHEMSEGNNNWDR